MNLTISSVGLYLGRSLPFFINLLPCGEVKNGSFGAERNEINRIDRRFFPYR